MADDISSAEGWQADKNMIKKISVSQDFLMFYISFERVMREAMEVQRDVLTSPSIYWIRQWSNNFLDAKIDKTPAFWTGVFVIEILLSFYFFLPFFFFLSFFLLFFLAICASIISDRMFIKDWVDY